MLEKAFGLLVAHYMILATLYLVMTRRIPRRFGLAMSGFILFGILEPILITVGLPGQWIDLGRWVIGLGVAVEGVRYVILDDMLGQVLRNYRRKITDEWLEIK